MVDDARDLFEVRTAHYRPPNRGLLPFYYPNRPPFTIATVESMRRDPQIKIGMRMIKAPLTKALFHIEAKDANVREFVANTLKRIWDRAVDDILDGLFYTRTTCEVVYCREEGRICFEGMRSVHPLDAKILVRGGMKWGLKVCNLNSEESDKKEIVLPGAKSFIYIHDREFSSWNGKSELEGAYGPWLDKNDRFGALASRKLWFYKNAFGGGILFHPPGNYTFTDGSGNTVKIPYRDLARQAIEQAQNGAVWTFDSVFDEQGRQQWQYIQPQVNSGSGELLNYVKELDTEIMRGLGIPDDVITQVSGTGSFAGRTIPLQSFFISLNETLKRIVNDLREQVIDYLVKLNFGAGHRYDVGSEVNTDALLPSTPSQEGAPKKIQTVEVPELAEAAA